MDKPLLVSGPLIKPVMDGRKTETRRLNGLDWVNELPDSWEFVGLNGKTATFQKYEGKLSMHVNCPYGVPGDTIWVRENWFASRSYNDKSAAELYDFAIRFGYAADFIDKVRPEWSGRVRPSIHMPKWVCRTFLEITAIHVERLHKITPDAAQREGIIPGFFREGPNTEKGEFHLEPLLSHPSPDRYLDGFKFIWMTLNGRESWDLNPWVWVVSFKLKNPTK